jgi:predicted O-linked N-acetylglucosamine transferase (SPINDLY family)
VSSRAGRARHPVTANGAPNAAAVHTLLEQGIQQHQSGNLALAAMTYQQVLEQVPDQPDALHLMGVVRHQSGEHREAIDLIRRSLKRKPKNADAYSNLGAAESAVGNLDAAAKSFKRAVKLNPKFVDAHANLAAISVRRGADEDAIRSFRKAQSLKPGEPRFMMRLAELYLKHDQFADAVSWYERYLSIAPDDPDAHNNMAYALDNLHRLKEAETYYGRAVELRPDKPEFANNWASVLQRLGRVIEADRQFKRAMKADPEQWEDLLHYAGALFNNGSAEKALALFETLSLERPDDGGLFRDYGIALIRTGRFDESEAALRRAISLCPDQDAIRIEFAHSLLRNKKNEEATEALKAISPKSPHYLAACLDLCLVHAGSDRLEEAGKTARKAAAHRDFKPSMFIKPYAVYRAACAFDDIDALPTSISEVEDRDLPSWAGLFVDLLPYIDTPEKTTDMVELHRRWSDMAVKAAADDVFNVATPIARSGPIRLGFVSSDLNKHSVARFILPLFERYDQDRFDIYAYSPDEDTTDEIQRRIRGLIKDFRVIGDKSFHDIARTIHDDNVDILFELNGFTAESRLNVMAYRPAPVQIYWLGYPGTTGMSTMDYVLLDKFNVPENLDWLTEEPLLMPGSWVCYDAFEQIAVPAEPPVVRNRVATFGTLNNPYKFTRQCIGLWAEILRQVPESRFLSVHPEHKAPLVADNLTREFEKHGIGANRLSFVNNRTATLSHFAYYEEIDISLDTLPLTGGTTTADALWCGVPVISLIGPSMHQRMSYSLLSNVGARDLCAETPQDYVTKAVALAGDIDRLRGFRRDLQETIRTSPLGNAEAFAEDFQGLMCDLVERHGLR